MGQCGRVRGTRIALEGDTEATQGNRVCGDRNAVGVRIRRLHRVAEDGDQAPLFEPLESGLPHRVADDQSELRRTGHGHRPVEGDAGFDRLAAVVGQAALRPVSEADRPHVRGYGDTAVYFPGRAAGDLGVGEVWGGRVASARDGSAVERQSVGSDRHPVDIHVGCRHDVGEEGVRGPRADDILEIGLRGVVADGQSELRRTGHLDGVAEHSPKIDRLAHGKGLAIGRLIGGEKDVPQLVGRGC